MPSIYAARLRNAHRIGRRIKRILASGGRVFDADGEPVSKCSFRGFSDSVGLTINDCLVLFDADTSLDNGMHDTIEQFNASFSGWTFVEPNRIRPLFRIRNRIRTTCRPIEENLGAA